ncbi:MAG: hypothetical protein ABIR47_10570 [Candidatus Kapaibacterium sp.]
MIRFALTVPVVALMIALSCAAQERSEKPVIPFGMCAGLHSGSAFFMEMGLGIAHRISFGPCGGGDVGFNGYTVSALFSPGSHPQAGVQGTVWFDAPLLAAGMNLAYYTDFNQGTLRLKPELGVGLLVARLVYSLSIPITNGGYSGIGMHQLSLRAYIPIRDR